MIWAWAYSFDWRLISEAIANGGKADTYNIPLASTPLSSTTLVCITWRDGMMALERAIVVVSTVHVLSVECTVDWA